MVDDIVVGGRGEGQGRGFGSFGMGGFLLFVEVLLEVFQEGVQGVRVGKVKVKEWMFFIKLGYLVKDMKSKFLEEICFFCLLIKEFEISDFFLEVFFKDEVLKIMFM